jgi:hypothetical protein
MLANPYLADRDDCAAAIDLIVRFGSDAGDEAAARAERSRGLGNALHFCRWRQIERLVLLLSVEHAVGTLH